MDIKILKKEEIKEISEFQKETKTKYKTQEIVALVNKKDLYRFIVKMSENNIFLSYLTSENIQDHVLLEIDKKIKKTFRG